jgi:type I restriction enzyme R subunit
VAAKEAKARIKINKLLEESGWRFFDTPEGKAEPMVRGTTAGDCRHNA